DFGSLISVKANRRTFVVPSEHSKFALRSYFPGLDSSEVRMLYSPSTQVMHADAGNSKVLEELQIRKKRYLLLVSGRRWQKNSYRALRALEFLKSNTNYLDDIDVVVVGGAPSSIPKRWRKLFIFSPYVSTEDLGRLYQDAFALIYPTLNEGFGYPPLEAMSRGTPAVVSSICSLPEIYKDCVLYFNPYHEHEIINRVVNLL